MERLTEDLDLDSTPTNWTIPAPKNEDWDVECDVDDRPQRANPDSVIRFYRIREMALIDESSSTTIDRLTRMRVSLLEQQLAELQQEVVHLRSLLANSSTSVAQAPSRSGLPLELAPQRSMNPSITHENSPGRLETLLDRLLRDDFLDSISEYMHPGREDRALARSSLVSDIVDALKSTPNARFAIEGCLDAWFRDFCVGQMFTHSEPVMALLFALKKSDLHFSIEIIGHFANTQMAELSALRRFAALLLSQ
jgi:hypothetical protein